jgi:hypothetical protein
LNIPPQSEIEQKILEYTITPMPKNEIADHLKADGYSSHIYLLEDSLLHLWREEKILRLRFVGRAGGGQKYSATDLFGPMAGKTIYSNNAYPEALAEFIRKNVQSKNDSKGFGIALSNRLNRILPKEVVQLI